MTTFSKLCSFGFILVGCLMLSGSQNIGNYWAHWHIAHAQFSDCQNNQDQACTRQWRSVLQATMNYNREANETPGRWWKHWLHPELPSCIRIPAHTIPVGQHFSAVTTQRLCADS
ncbi:MAG: hypothetical protein CMI09_14815 [Oceanospirillaceae bacterium]|nr:hypothetical protein [Oceanospirillaceae bacterium]